jgi:hypothetical protein
MKIVITAGLLLIGSVCSGQQKTFVESWSWLMGEWQGEGDGKPGKGSGKFTFLPDLDKKIIVRKNHSEYPATKDKPKIVHDDLMVVYPDFSGNSSKAIYFDNEGHVINYGISLADSSVVMTSDKALNAPVFRLTYRLRKNKAITVKFEMSQDGEKFMTYTEGKCVRIK